MQASSQESDPEDAIAGYAARTSADEPEENASDESSSRALIPPAWIAQRAATWALKSAKGLLNVAIILFFLVAAVRIFDNAVVTTSWSTPQQLVSVLVILIVARLMISRRVLQWGTRVDRSDVEHEPSEVVAGRVTEYASQFLEHNDPGQIRGLLDTLTRPQDHFKRITEDVQIHISTYTQKTRITYRCGRDGESLVPLISRRKGELLDGLEISCEGSPMQPLPYLENQGAAILLVDTIIEALVVDLPDLRTYQVEIQELVSSPSSVNPANLLRRLAGLKTASIGAADKVLLERLKQIVEECSESYLVLALIPGELGRIVEVTIEHSRDRMPPDMSKLEPLRVVLGLRDRRHRFYISRAGQATSYHFSARAPSGMYLHECRLILATGLGASGRAASKPAPSNLDAGRANNNALEIAQNDSLKNAHLYIRGHSTEGERPKFFRFRIEVRERPPSITEVTTLLAAVLLTMVWIVTMYHGEIFLQESGQALGGPDDSDASSGRRDGGPSGLWPTVLFGIPVLLAGWLVTRLDAPALGKISLLSLSLALWFAGNSLLAIGATAFKSLGVTASKGEFAVWIPHVDIHHPFWALVVVSCTANFASCLVASLCRALRYISLMKRWTTNRFEEYNG